MYLIFDTETTGLPKRWDAPVSDTDNWPRCVQIAWQLHDARGVLLEQFDALVQPDGFNIPFEAEQIHGISTRLAREEGIFSEPAGATALAGLLAAAAKPGALDPAAPVVCLVTGSGFKDGPSIDAMLAGRGCPTLPDLAAFEGALAKL